MFHSTVDPAAFHWLAQYARSPSMRTKSRAAARSRSMSVAATSTSPSAENRRAVSFSTAKASGITSSRISSRPASMSFSKPSIWSYKTSLASKDIAGLAATCAFSWSDSETRPSTWARIRERRSRLRSRSPSAVSACISESNDLMASIAGWMACTSEAALSPTRRLTILLKAPIMWVRSSRFSACGTMQCRARDVDKIKGQRHSNPSQRL